MRVVAGTYGGRRLLTPRGSQVRPTSDKVREALFSILGTIEGFELLDLYAGTGAIAFEALSRGAKKVTLVEKDRVALETIADNRKELGVPEERIEILAIPVDKAIERFIAEKRKFDRLFSDPPWAEATGAHRRLLPHLAELLVPGGTAVLEHDRREAAPEAPAGVTFGETRRYGDTALSFYVRPADKTSSVAAKQDVGSRPAAKQDVGSRPADKTSSVAAKQDVGSRPRGKG